MLAFSLLHDSGGSSAEPDATDTSRFFGIVQGIRLDSQDFQAMARAGVGSDRFLLIWGDVQPKKGGPYNWGPTDALIGAFAAHGIQVVPDLWRSPPWVAGPLVAPPIDRPEDLKAWQAFLKAAVARYGPDGDLLVHGLQEAVRGRRHAAAGPVVAGLERAQPVEVLRPEPVARAVRPPARDLPRRDQERRIRTPRSCSPGCPATATSTPGSSSTALRRPGVEKRLRRGGALHPYAPTSSTLQLEIEQVREVMTKHGDSGNAAVDHRDRLGIGAARQVRDQPGAAGPERDAEGVASD